MRVFRTLFSIFILALWSTSPRAHSAEPAEGQVSFGIAETPAWIQPASVDSVTSPETVDDGIYYVLVDQQENLEPRTSYYHEARLITSPNGLQNGAAVSASFEPSYQKLVFHTIRIIRQGVAIDRLHRSQIKLIRRERDMERFLYNGSYTAQCDLEDVRVGDIIECAYTIEGANPVLQGKYFDSFYTDWEMPVHRAKLRIVRPEQRSLHFQIKNHGLQTVVGTRDGISEWRWEDTEIKARKMDPNTPRGYDPYGRVQVTEFDNWQQVADWAIPLYESDAPLSPEFEAEIAGLGRIQNAEERIKSALSFVQDQIRYLGIESGPGSHKPTAPSEVLRRRFGDCKDKVWLLATLLRRCGLEASPALVSTALREKIAERLPSPGAFNHVILRVEDGGNVHWLDATRSYQRGPLSQISIGKFSYALVVRPGTRDLTAFAPPPRSLPKKTVVETYHLNPPDKESRLDVVTDSLGLSAEITRTYFYTTNREDIQKEYLRYYAKSFPRAKSAGPLGYEELPGEIGCRVTEHYIIPAIWELNSEKTQYDLTLHPGDVGEAMGTPGAEERNDPLALRDPVNVTQEIRAEMFEKWPLTPSHKEVANKLFRFRADAESSGSKLTMTYSFQSLADQVAPAGLAEYQTALRKAKDMLGYTLTYRTPEQLALTRRTSGLPEGQFNTPIAVLLGAILIVVIVFCVRFYFQSKLAESLPPPFVPRALVGIGGWLILVAIGLIVRPLTFAKGVVQLYPSIFRLETWRALTQAGESYHPLWMPVLLFELIFQSLGFVYSILLLFLFFKRRAAWPRCFAFLLAAIAVANVIDSVLGSQIPAVRSAHSNWAKGLVQGWVQAAIWIPYVFVSKRVGATFRF